MAPDALVDIGVNLGHRQFDADRDQVIARALAAGVTTLVLTGTSVAGSREALALARAHPGTMLATAGIHPHHASQADARALVDLRELAEDPLVVAMGECGLDFERNFSPPVDQERAFHAQLELAAVLGLPVFLHERRAHARFVAILGEHRERLPGAVVHCFTGTADELAVYLELDCHVGITGWICDERRGRHLLELVPRIPADRLMLETDAPFLTPRDLRPLPRRNEPAFLTHVLARVAQASGRPPAEVAAQTTATARAFFRRR
jgi:TatD DNase family protein